MHHFCSPFYFEREEIQIKIRNMGGMCLIKFKLVWFNKAATNMYDCLCVCVCVCVFYGRHGISEHKQMDGGW